MPRDYYFVRVNGLTGHNDPSKPQSYVPGEPPRFPKRFFSYTDYCLREKIVRIGWPGTKQLTAGQPVPERVPCYTCEQYPPHVRQYLDDFCRIAAGDVILMPDRERPGTLFIGDVTKPYWYFHQTPQHPYECAHRVGVNWDCDRAGAPREYQARDLGIGIRGGFWTRAFYRFEPERDPDVLRRIDRARRA